MGKDLLTELGYDPNDPDVIAALDDAHEVANMLQTLATIRRQLGLRQKDVARLAGTTQSAISDFERIGGDPKVSTIQRVARALGVQIRLRAEVVSDNQRLPVSSQLGSSSWYPPSNVPTWTSPAPDHALAA